MASPYRAFGYGVVASIAAGILCWALALASSGDLQAGFYLAAVILIVLPLSSLLVTLGLNLRAPLEVRPTKKWRPR